MNKMVTEVLEIVKAKLGITSTVRDPYITAIINGVVDELRTKQGIVINETSQSDLMFVADYAEFRYSNKDNPVMPRHLQLRLHNLMISDGGTI